MNQLLVISSFPPKGTTHHKAIVGIASYTKNTLISLKNTKITVLAEKFSDGESSYQDKEITVKRVWKRGSLFPLFSIFRTIITSHKEKNILFELELSMFGTIFQLFPVPLFILALRILGKRVNVVLHQVIPSFSELHGQVNIKEDSIKTKLYNFLNKAFYSSILKTGSKIIVFDQVLKDRLLKITKGDVVVIPHGVEEFKNKPSQKLARERLKISLGDFVILYFGFIAWYKGTDILVNNFIEIPEDIRKEKKLKLIIAGGANPNHLDKSFYKEYIKDIEKKCQANEIELTGFVAEEDIPSYFSAADLVVFPYRSLMSASGPLSIAFSFNKPFLISDKMSPLLETADFKKIVSENGLVEEDLVSFFDQDFEKELTSFNQEKINKVARVSEETAKERSWREIGDKYYEQIFSSN